MALNRKKTDYGQANTATSTRQEHNDDNGNNKDEIHTAGEDAENQDEKYPNVKDIDDTDNDDSVDVIHDKDGISFAMIIVIRSVMKVKMTTRVMTAKIYF